MKKSSILFLLYFSILQAVAQTSTIKKAQTSFDKAQDYLREDAYEAAITSLQDAVKADPSFQFAFIQLGDINRRIKKLESARIAYKNALTLGGNVDPRVYYGLAETEFFTGNYAEAAKNINFFIQNYKGTDKEFLKKALKYQKDCSFALEALKSPVNYNPVNMGKEVNSIYRDYSPSITADGESLIFCRNIEGNEDFFIANKVMNQWSTPFPLSDKINSKRFNEGAQSISPDGLYLFFTGCNRPDGLGRCDIYVSHKDGNNWGEPFNLGAPINSEYWDSQPAISPDGKTLYFVSNRPGGLGGYDIWKSSLKDDGYWDEPKNLGPDINTEYDEQTPFIHHDGKTLYFSSNGWPGMGNKDIFLSRLSSENKWSQPENLGYPINTFNEETGLVVTADGNEALFSSNLKGGFGDMDIYQFKMPHDKKPYPVHYVKGIVKDKVTGVFLESLVQVVDLESKHSVFNDYTSKATGSFLSVMPSGSSYAFNVSAEGYLFYSENYELNLSEANKNYVIEINLEKLKVGNDVILKNIFFNTNEYRLLPTSLTELATLIELLNNNSTMFIEIQGHTDNIGNDQVNQQLSLNRAKAVYDYLVAHKIGPERLSFKGYGETRPITGNDTPDKRRQNRRTSFTITKI